MEDNAKAGNADEYLKVIDTLNKDLKTSKKRLEKLEEKFIKTNNELKNIGNDKLQLDNFLRSIFPREMHDNVIQSEFGLYDCSELSKYWLIADSKKQNEFHKILNDSKNENNELMEKYKTEHSEFEAQSRELALIRQTINENQTQLEFYRNNYNDIVKKNENLEIEKHYLINLLDEKSKEIDKLSSFEIENAELKAKSLLETIENGSSRVSEPYKIYSTGSTPEVSLRISKYIK